MVFKAFDEGTPCEGKAATKSSLGQALLAPPTWLCPTSESVSKGLTSRETQESEKGRLRIPCSCAFCVGTVLPVTLDTLPRLRSRPALAQIPRDSKRTAALSSSRLMSHRAAAAWRSLRGTELVAGWSIKVRSWFCLHTQDQTGSHAKT